MTCGGRLVSEARRTVRVWLIMWTAHSAMRIVASLQGDDHRAECFADGFSDFLTKPITPQSVRGALGRYAASVAGGPAAAVPPAPGGAAC